MIELQSHNTVKAGSNRGFGLVFSAVFAVIAAWPVLSGGPVRLWAAGIAVGFAIIAFAFPRILTVPNQLWTKFGLLLGAIVAPIVMMLVFFVAVTPIALLMRAFGKDPLRLKLDKSSESYWITREEPVGPMKNQF